MAEIVILATESTKDHTRPFLEHFGDRILIETDWRPSAVLRHQPDLVIEFDESQYDRAVCIAEIVRHRVATLQFMDGILEWRNTWHRRTSTVIRPLNQPILAHKIACLGRVDARLLESWGNIGKCEIVGSVRLDPLINLAKPMRLEAIQGRPLRLMVMTAKNPGFTPEEIEITYRSLKDMRDVLEQRDDIQVTWRITKGLHKPLEVKNTFSEASGKEFHEVLAQADALITTPSTAMLEGMLFGLPVALLDYHNCPHYVPAAWRITCKDQIVPVLEDLLHVPLERMLYQEFCLNEALACRTPAISRAIMLIEEMIRIKRAHDANATDELSFPHHILNQPDEFISWPSTAYDLERLYPNHPTFGRRDTIALLSELDAAVNAYEQTKEQVNTLTQRLHRIPGYLAAKQVVRRVQKYLAQH